jgi:hypothetical protein
MYVFFAMCTRGYLRPNRTDSDLKSEDERNEVLAIYFAEEALYFSFSSTTGRGRVHTACIARQ